MNIDIDYYLDTVAKAVKNKKVPVVDLINVQTRDPFKVLVATILSARTKDEVTAAASANLFKHAPDIQSLASLSEEKIRQLIHPVGFYKNKARYLIQLPKALTPFADTVPDTIDELLTLPGVGRKTANLVVSVAFRKPAICVDTHVHRIMNIWGYVDTKNPLKTEMALRDKLPPRHWINSNTILVAFGQYICRPVSPHCDICPLNDKCAKQGVQPRTVAGAKKKRKGVLKFISWNVNGIRAVEKKGFIKIVREFDADIIAIQETKAQPDQLSEPLKNIAGYTSFWHSSERKGYSSVAVYTRLSPVAIHYGLGDPEFDVEGRVLTLEYNSFFLVNIYFPNSGDKLKRIDYKLRFNNKLLAFAQTLRKDKPVILCGDFNVAHREIDLKNPQANIHNAGFTEEERQWMDSFLDAGFIDTFRIFNQEAEQYSWWSYRYNARARNIGWRIDYFCVDKKSENRIKDASILQDITGSDHCPVQLEYIL